MFEADRVSRRATGVKRMSKTDVRDQGDREDSLWGREFQVASNLAEARRRGEGYP